MQRLPSLRVASLVLLALAPLVSACLAVVLGKDAGWDFQNYHWYNPFALLQQRLGFDLAVGHHASYYNPLLDLPLYWVAQHGPAWMGGALLGALYGVVVSLLGALAYQIFPLANPSRRLLIAAILALLGVIGGGAFSVIGNTSHDVSAAIGIFAALLIVVSNWSVLQRATIDRKSLWLIFIAGILAGMSVGLKLTVAIYAPGILLALICVTTTRRAASAYAISLCIGIAVGIALCAGYWMQRMWEFGRNPLFPYFNQLFHSPLLLDRSYRDPSFFPDSLLQVWAFPFYFTADSHLVSEWHFRDAHILAAYIIVPITLVLLWIKRVRRDSVVQPKLAMALFAFAAASYFAWLMLFCIYRYVIPLEMLCPTLVAAAVMLWPIPRVAQLGLLLAIFAASQAVVEVALQREPWDEHYVSVKVPNVPDLPHSMVLMGGDEPMSFVIPSFPASVPFLRIDGWLVDKEDHRSGLAREMHARVNSDRGPLYMLYGTDDLKSTLQAAQEYHLAFANEKCAQVTSNIAAPLLLCKLTRLP